MSQITHPNLVNTSHPGLVPKLPNDSTKFLNGVGAFAVPAGGGSGNIISNTAIGSEPGSPSAGDTDIYTDAPMIAQYESSVWVKHGPIYKLTPFVDSGFTWQNQGSATKTVGNGLIYMTAPAQTGYSVKSYWETAPGTPYTLTGLVRSHYHATGSPISGLLFRESATSKLMIFGPASGTAGQPSVFYFTNDTTLSSSLLSTTLTPVLQDTWIRIANDGTTLTFSVSLDTVNWITYYSEAKAAHFTTAPDQIGLAITSDSNTSLFCVMSVFSYLKG